MNDRLDAVLVCLALLASAVYAAAALGPRAWRARTAAALASAAARLPARFGLRRAAQWLARTPVGGACGGCGGCESQDSAGKPQGGDVRIPLARIGRRARD